MICELHSFAFISDSVLDTHVSKGGEKSVSMTFLVVLVSFHAFFFRGGWDGWGEDLFLLNNLVFT